jgi:uncharacterized protein (DUF58 family)
MKVVVRAIKNRITMLWRMSRADADVIITVRQRAIVIAWLVLAVWCVLRPVAFAFTGLVAISALLLLSYLWARSMARGVSSRRTLRYTAVQVGDELEEMLMLDNRSRLPVVWAEFVDRSTAPGYSIGGVRVAGRRTTAQWRLHTSCTQRGVYSLGPWDICLGDPFGIFEARQTYRQQTEIVVYPPLAALPPELAHHRRTIGDRRALRQPLAADTISATTTRPYVLGDSLHRVHWRTTARHAELFVKVFEPEASSTMWLLPDLDARVHVGEGNDSSLEKMIVLVASLAAKLLNDHLSVGVLFDAARAGAVMPQAGSAHLWTILRALAVAQSSDARSLAETLSHARSIASLRDSIVIVTPSIDPAWIGAAQHLTAGPRADGVEVVLLDPMSFGGPASADPFASILIEQGIATHVLRREDIRPMTGAYGNVRRWEFKTLGTGRVVVRQTPRTA